MVFVAALRETSYLLSFTRSFCFCVLLNLELVVAGDREKYRAPFPNRWWRSTSIQTSKHCITLRFLLRNQQKKACFKITFVN